MWADEVIKRHILPEPSSLFALPLGFRQARLAADFHRPLPVDLRRVRNARAARLASELEPPHRN